MPTRSKAEWEAKQAADELKKQAGNDERAQWQAELDEHVAKAATMKGAKFKKERQGVYAAIGRLKALLNGQEVRNQTGEKPASKPAVDKSWDSWQQQDSWVEGASDQAWEPTSSSGMAWEETWGQEEWRQEPITAEPAPGSTLMMLRGLDGLSADEVSPDTLRELCGRDGATSQLGSIKIPLNRKKRSRGFAFVEVFDAVAATKMLKTIDGAMCHGQKLTAKLVPPKGEGLAAAPKKQTREPEKGHDTPAEPDEAQTEDEGAAEEVVTWDKNAKKELKALKALSDLGRTGEKEQKRLKQLKEAKLVAELKVLRGE